MANQPEPKKCQGASCECIGWSDQLVFDELLAIFRKMHDEWFCTYGIHEVKLKGHVIVYLDRGTNLYSSIGSVTCLGYDTGKLVQITNYDG